MSGIDSFTKGCWDCEGADASTTFGDLSAFGHSLTAHGNAQVDTAQFKFGTASALFAASGDYLTADGSSDFAFGTGDFVVDFWVRFSATGVMALMDWNTTGSNNPFIYMLTGPFSVHFVSAGGIAIDGGTTMTTDTWYHIALVRSSGVTYLFLNGIEEGHVTDATSYGVGTNGPSISDWGGFNPLKGWVDMPRITKGHDRGWAGGFTPPTNPYTRLGRNLMSGERLARPRLAA